MRFLLSATLLFAFLSSVLSHPFDQLSSSDVGCTTTYPQMEGPYWANSALVRSDVTEGEAGIPLYLNLVLLNQSSTTTCQPLVGAAADIWHANATGYYSHFTGYDPDKPAGGAGPAIQTDNLDFSRGVQISDKNGEVNFITIYPGWYYGRCIHIHLEVHLHGSVVEGRFVTSGADAYTGQLFFDDSWTAKVATFAPYSSHTSLTYTPNAKDFIYVGSHGASNLLTLVPVDSSNIALGFHTTFVVNVDTSTLQEKASILNKQSRDFTTYRYL